MVERRAHAAGRGRVASLVAAGLVALLAFPGCGGGDDEDPAEDWASSVCSNLSAWVTDVDEAVQSLTDAGLATDEEDVQRAVDDIQQATEALGEDLEELGPPETEGGEQARSELESLQTTLQQQIDTVREALDEDGGGASLVATVSTAVATAATEVESTYSSLQGVDPGGELQDGFENADDCDSLRDQIDQLGS